LTLLSGSLALLRFKAAGQLGAARQSHVNAAAKGLMKAAQARPGASPFGSVTVLASGSEVPLVSFGESSPAMYSASLGELHAIRLRDASFADAESQSCVPASGYFWPACDSKLPAANIPGTSPAWPQQSGTPLADIMPCR